MFTCVVFEASRLVVQYTYIKWIQFLKIFVCVYLMKKTNIHLGQHEGE